MFKSKFKKGAASFYIIAFSTLILLIIAMSFAAIIISQITRTSNSDLSQSAYDSAMAGVEDAKLAYYNYQDCINRGTSAASGLNRDGDLSCDEIVYLVDESNSCDTVGYLLGRFGENVNPEDITGVQIKEEEETVLGNNMSQAYTCVKMQTSLDSYDATLSSSNPIRVIKAKFDGIEAKDIHAVQISWYSDRNLSENGGKAQYTNFDSTGVKFSTDNIANRAMPPTISLGMIQTAVDFNFSDFDLSVDDTTDRGMIYMVPTGNKNTAKNKNNTYIGAYNGEINSVDKNALVDSNAKIKQNLPYGVFCPDNSGNRWLCTATVYLPKPVGGERSNDTFMFVVALPYGQPETDISLSFLCGDNNTSCKDIEIEGVNEESDVGVNTATKKVASLKGVQVGVDSTGRANDLYRRVEVRLDVEGTSNGLGGSLLSILGPLELSGDGGNNGSDDGDGNKALRKDSPVTCEWNFNSTGPKCLEDY